MQFVSVAIMLIPTFSACLALLLISILVLLLKIAVFQVLRNHGCTLIFIKNDSVLFCVRSSVEIHPLLLCHIGIRQPLMPFEGVQPLMCLLAQKCCCLRLEKIGEAVNTFLLNHPRFIISHAVSSSSTTCYS